MERLASLTWCKLKTTPKIFILLFLVTLICGIAVHQNIKYFTIRYNTFETNPSFVRSSRMASGKKHFTADDSKTNTRNQSGRRTEDKITEILSEKPLKKSPPKQPDSTKNKGPSVKEEVDIIYEEMAMKHSARSQLFRENCKRLINKSDGKISTVKYDLFFSSDYNLGWKLVPKIGSTFLIQAFGILNEKLNQKVFDKARSNIHGSNFSYRKKFSLKQLNNYTVLIMARNPFSRLFSAYIDKVYLPNKIDLTKRVYLHNVARGDPRNCKFKMTFNEFLNYALNNKIKRLGMGHYGPVLSETKCLKFPSIPNILIVKQESFSDDIEYALNIAGVKGSKNDSIYSALHGKNAQIAIVSIVKTVYMKMKGSYKKIRSYTASEDCLSWSDTAQRLWKSFQIQGYIHDKIDFPHDRFKSNAQYEDASYLIEVMLEEIKKRPLTHEEKKKQRTRALLDAYTEVSEENISKIVKQYNYDFSSYDYSTDFRHALDVNT